MVVSPQTPNLFIVPELKSNTSGKKPKKQINQYVFTEKNWQQTLPTIQQIHWDHFSTSNAWRNHLLLRR